MNSLHRKSFIALQLAVFSLGLCGCTEQLSQDVKKLQSSLNDLRRIQAEQTTRLDELESASRALSGRVETLEYGQNKRIGGDLDALRQDLTDLRKRVPPPGFVPLSILESDEGSVAKWPRELGDTVNQGFQFLRAGKFEDADLRFKEALELGRGTQWAADIMFWNAVTLEGLKSERDALRIYVQIVAEFKKHSKAPVALYRQASIFNRLGDAKAAKVTLRKLVTDYPKSDEATDAREQLKRM